MRQKIKFDKLMGFTLIELLIAIVIVSILTAVAFPSYQNYVRQSNRAAAKAILYENAQFMEQFYTENNRYDATAGEMVLLIPLMMWRLYCPLSKHREQGLPSTTFHSRLRQMRHLRCKPYRSAPWLAMPVEHIR